MWFQSTSHNKGSVLQSMQDLFTKHLMLCYAGLEKGQQPTKSTACKGSGSK